MNNVKLCVMWADHVLRIAAFPEFMIIRVNEMMTYLKKRGVL